jgi:hypothetical protein
VIGKHGEKKWSKRSHRASVSRASLNVKSIHDVMRTYR